MNNDIDGVRSPEKAQSEDQSRKTLKLGSSKNPVKARLKTAPPKEKVRQIELFAYPTPETLGAFRADNETAGEYVHLQVDVNLSKLDISADAIQIARLGLKTKTGVYVEYDSEGGLGKFVENAEQVYLSQLRSDATRMRGYARLTPEIYFNILQSSISQLVDDYQNLKIPLQVEPKAHFADHIHAMQFTYYRTHCLAPRVQLVVNADAAVDLTTLDYRLFSPYLVKLMALNTLTYNRETLEIDWLEILVRVQERAANSMREFCEFIRTGNTMVPPKCFTYSRKIKQLYPEFKAELDTRKSTEKADRLSLLRDMGAKLIAVSSPSEELERLRMSLEQGFEPYGAYWQALHSTIIGKIRADIIEPLAASGELDEYRVKVFFTDGDRDPAWSTLRSTNPSLVALKIREGLIHLINDEGYFEKLGLHPDGPSIWFTRKHQDEVEFHYGPDYRDESQETIGFTRLYPDSLVPANPYLEISVSPKKS